MKAFCLSLCLIFPLFGIIGISYGDSNLSNGSNPPSDRGAMTLSQPSLAVGEGSQTNADSSDQPTAESSSSSSGEGSNPSDWNALSTQSNPPETQTKDSQSSLDVEAVGGPTLASEALAQAREAEASAPNELPAQVGQVTSTLQIGEVGDEHMVWRKKPIEFVIPTGKERMITFPSKIATISADDNLGPDKISLIYNDGTLYLKALRAFDPLLVIVHLKDSDQSILLHLSSTPSADDTPVDVVLDSINLGQSGDSTSGVVPAKPSQLSYIDLLRFAIRALYAPERLVEASSEIARAPMYTEKTIALMKGHDTEDFPEASWRGQDYFVTAILIKNTQTRPLILDPRAVEGDWLASSFYPTNRLAPRGQRGDETTLFLVSALPFGEAFRALNTARRGG